MAYIKSTYSPRAVKVTKQEYLSIYPDRQAGMILVIVFNRSSVAQTSEEIAKFLVGKYKDIGYLDTPPDYSKSEWREIVESAKAAGISPVGKKREALEVLLREAWHDKAAAN